MNAPLFDERFRLERRPANGIDITVRYGEDEHIHAFFGGTLS